MGSRALAKADREPDDLYESPALVVEGCLATLPPSDLAVAFDPCAGGGAFSRPLRDMTGVLHLNEFREKHRPALELVEADSLTYKMFQTLQRSDYPDLDAVVSNPPYTLALTFIQHGLYLVRPGGIVGYLLRVGVLHTKDRASFRRRFPPWRVYTLDARPSFDGEGTDGSEYAFIIWRRGWAGDTITRPLAWHDPVMLRDDLEVIRAKDWPAARIDALNAGRYP